MLWDKFSDPTSGFAPFIAYTSTCPPGRSATPANPQEVDRLVEREVIELLLGNDHVVRRDPPFQEFERARGAARQAAPLGVLDFHRVRVDAERRCV